MPNKISLNEIRSIVSDTVDSRIGSEWNIVGFATGDSLKDSEESVRSDEYTVLFLDSDGIEQGMDVALLSSNKFVDALSATYAGEGTRGPIEVYPRAVKFAALSGTPELNSGDPILVRDAGGRSNSGVATMKVLTHEGHERLLGAGHIIGFGKEGGVASADILYLGSLAKIGVYKEHGIGGKFDYGLSSIDVKFKNEADCFSDLFQHPVAPSKGDVYCCTAGAGGEMRPREGKVKSVSGDFLVTVLGKEYEFNNQILIKGRDGFARGGDSGSLIMKKIGMKAVPVGLLFAADVNERLFLANRMLDLFDEKRLKLS